MTMSDDLNWKEWFKKHEGSGIALYYGEEPWITPDIEDFYQAFKARLIAEQQCQTCGGNGMIGGFVNAENGYDSEPCPDCNPVEQQEPVADERLDNLIALWNQGVAQSNDLCQLIDLLLKERRLYTDAGQQEPVVYMREGATEVMHNFRFDKPGSGPWVPLCKCRQIQAQKDDGS